MSWQRKQTEKKTKEYGPRTFDRSCKNSGSCPWCRGNRTVSTQKNKLRGDDEIMNFIRNNYEDD